MSWRFRCPPPTLRVGGQGTATKATDNTCLREKLTEKLFCHVLIYPASDKCDPDRLYESELDGLGSAGYVPTDNTDTMNIARMVSVVYKLRVNGRYQSLSK